jgi:hypothetical protein
VTAHEHTRSGRCTSFDDPVLLDDCPLTLPVSGFETTTTRIAPRESLLIDDGEWNGALILVTAGSVDLECLSGATHSFPTGSMLWFTSLGLRAIHNNATSTAVLVSTRRTAIRLPLGPPVTTLE